MASEAERLNKVINNLNKIPQETKQMVFNMSCGMTDQEIIQSFNQQSYDLFNIVALVVKKLKKDNEFKVVGYRAIFDNAIKINNRLPLDKFTLMILEYASEIYEEQEDLFLNMKIPDKDVSAGNEFGIIRSEMFKSIWRLLGTEDKTKIKEIVIPLTTYAHAYLYKTILKNQKPQ